ncbi:poly-gamma-glutamate hydrolase family protein [Halobacillus massiliensis]|uniref:poly-gamma-glutamate hydrolase family protein n=1 Tax=Halobacillus massiliensis TaxID=1926286 RepID=UPI0015C41044|nr:poly-gamma-glutamate hydrolase family protein [Halobacillus massiliensis]
MNTKILLPVLAAAAFLGIFIVSLMNRNEDSSNAEENDCSGDRFCSYAELAEVYEEGKDYEIMTNTNGDQRWLVSAIHGGGIEAATSNLAEAIAGSSFPFYTFKGRLSSNNYSNLHITATHFDEPRALKMAGAAESNISIHGTSGNLPQTMIGGLDENLKDIICLHLREKGFVVTKPPEHLDGDHPENIANRTKTGKGVQLEITRAQREAFFKNGDISYASRNNASNQTETFKAYAAAIQAAMDEYK